MEEAQRVFAKLSTSGPRSERSWGYLGLANAYRDLDSPDAALATMRVAAQTAPWMYLAWQNIGDIEEETGRLEAALADHRAAVKLLDRPDRGGIRSDMAGNTRARILSYIDQETGDFASAVRRRTGVAAFGRQGLLGSASALLVESDVADHDLIAARAALNPSDVSTISPGRATFDNIRAAMLIEVAAGDWSAALASQAQAAQLVVRWPGLAKVAPAQIAPLAAEAMARTGDLTGAEALIASAPTDCDLCLRERGRIAALKRDWPAAGRWFAQAVRIAPSIPFAYSDWGAMLLAKGDPDGAIAKLSLAHQKGPHFADPLELWGEALMRKGDYAGAAAKFAEADKDAPHWGRNHLRWGEALWRAGQASAARVQFQAARALDLSVPDRAALEVFLARIGQGGAHG